MRLKDYARQQKKRKEFVQQAQLLMIGVDVSKAKNDACFGTQTEIIFSIDPGSDHANLFM